MHMTKYFLGVDVGSTKTHALITDQVGNALGFGESGPGNHEVVGYSGLVAALTKAVEVVLASAGLEKNQISGAGFGISGYDWPSEKEPILQSIATLGFDAPFRVVNDTILGLLAGASNGWGIAIVSGSGCNCRGWDPEHRREGRVTGDGWAMGEGAGASELVMKARQAVAHEWTRRGPATQLTTAFLEYTSSQSLEEMLEGLVLETIRLDARAAPLVFQAANAGDMVAIEVIRWAGIELGELAKSVIRQLAFEELEFDVVLIGSLFEGGSLLIEPARQTIQAYAPGARLVRLVTPPVTGAVLLGMEATGIRPTKSVHNNLSRVRIEV
jgi:N-acetylglucosamine kinase-like BadF-type ATPase